MDDLIFSRTRADALSSVEYTLEKLSRFEQYRENGTEMQQKAVGHLDAARAKRAAILAISEEEWQARHAEYVAYQKRVSDVFWQALEHDWDQIEKQRRDAEHV